MCRMLIAIGNVHLKPLLESMSLVAKDSTSDHELNSKGRGTWQHDDGWGIAYIKDNEWIVEKSLTPLFQDQKTHQFKDIITNLAIIHTRKKMGSEKGIQNTHPFQHEDIIFCHNGYITDDIPCSDPFIPTGETDSEKLFCSILKDIQHKSMCHETIKNNLKKYQKYTGTNIIFSDKECSIIATKRNIYPKYYEMQLLQQNDLIIVSSEQLQQFNSWQPIQAGELIKITHKTLNVQRIPSLPESE